MRFAVYKVTCPLAAFGGSIRPWIYSINTTHGISVSKTNGCCSTVTMLYVQTSSDLLHDIAVENCDRWPSLWSGTPQHSRRRGDLLLVVRHLMKWHNTYIGWVLESFITQPIESDNLLILLTCVHHNFTMWPRLGFNHTHFFLETPEVWVRFKF